MSAIIEATRRHEITLPELLSNTEGKQIISNTEQLSQALLQQIEFQESECMQDSCIWKLMYDRDEVETEEQLQASSIRNASGPARSSLREFEIAKRGKTFDKWSSKRVCIWCKRRGHTVRTHWLVRPTRKEENPEHTDLQKEKRAFARGSCERKRSTRRRNEKGSMEKEGGFQRELCERERRDKG